MRHNKQTGKHSSVAVGKKHRASCQVRLYSSVYTRAYDPLLGARGHSRLASLYKPRILSWDRFATLMQNKVFANPIATVAEDELDDKEAWKVRKLSQRVSVFSLPKTGKAVQAVVFDYDNMEDLGDFDKLLMCVAKSPYECLLHTTSSHTDIHPKLHLIFPLREPIACSKMCDCVCMLIEKLDLPTCFDSSVFLPGWSLYLPEERVADGFCEWHKHAESGKPLAKFSAADIKGTSKVRKLRLKKYAVYLGAILNKLSDHEVPPRFEDTLKDRGVKHAAYGMRSLRRNIDYFREGKYKDIQPKARARITKALDSISVYVTQAVYLAQHDYALSYLQHQSELSDIVEYKSSSSLYNSSKKRMLLLSMPCPKCASKGNKRVMFGSCYLDSGYLKMTCVSTSCQHVIERKLYESKMGSGYVINAIKFWSILLDYMQSSIVVLENTNAQFLCIGSVLVPLDLFCSTLHMSFHNRFSIKQAAALMPQCIIKPTTNYNLGPCSLESVQKIVKDVPLLDSNKKIVNDNIFVVRGSRTDLMFKKILTGNMFPLLMGKLSGSTFATKRKLGVAEVTKAFIGKEMGKCSTNVLAQYLPPDIYRAVTIGGIAMLPPVTLLSKLRRLPPAVYVTIEPHRSSTEIPKIRQRCMLAALRGIKVFIIPKISKGRFFEPAFRVCKMLNIKQTHARSIASCARMLGVPKNFERETAKIAHEHFLATQGDRDKLLKKVSKPQKQEIESPESTADNNVVLKAGGHTSVPKKSNTTEMYKRATPWGSLLVTEV